MDAPPRGRSPRPATIALALVTVLLGVLLVAPIGTLGSSSTTVAPTLVAHPAASGLSAYATWNGVNVATAASQSSAFRQSFGANVTVTFYWSQGLGSAPISVDDARLQIFYFGFALGTRDITTVGAATSPLAMNNWNTGPLQYILAGTYMLTASLLATNGSTVWSQSFWVNVAAPYYILALLPIVLIVIAIYEVYALCTCGKYDIIGKTSPKAGGSATPGAGAPANAPATDTPATTESGPTPADSEGGAPPGGGAP